MARPTLQSSSKTESGFLGSSSWNITNISHTAGRSLVVIVAASVSGSSSSIVSAITYNSVAADLIFTNVQAYNPGPGKNVAICYWANPGDQTNKTVAVTWSANVRSAVAFLAQISDIKASDPTGSTAGGGAEFQTSCSATLNIESSTDSLVIVAHSSSNEDSSVTLDSPLTEQDEHASTNDSSGVRANFGTHTPTSTGNQQYTGSSAVNRVRTILGVEFLGTASAEGTLTATLAGCQLQTEAQVPAFGVLSANLGAVSLSSQGSGESSINLFATTDNATVSSTGTVEIQGTASTSLESATVLSGITVGTAVGVVDLTLEAAQLAAIINSEALLSADITLQSASLLASGDSGIVWPDSLPAQPLVGQYAHQMAENAVVSGFEGYPIKRRRRGTNSPKKFSVVFEFTEEEYVIFDQFYTSTLLTGLKRFSWVHPVFGTLQARFTTPPVAALYPGHYYQVTCEWEV